MHGHFIQAYNNEFPLEIHTRNISEVIDDSLAGKNKSLALVLVEEQVAILTFDISGNVY